MDNLIDLDAIIDNDYWDEDQTRVIKDLMRLLAHQLLLLAAERAELVEINEPEYTATVLNKQSILDIEKLIV